MIRTQIYLTEQQKGELEAFSERLGKKQSELIREAIDQFLSRKSLSRRDKVLREAAGIWKNRKDLPGFSKERASWDRS